MPASLITQFSLLDTLETDLTNGALLVADLTAQAIAASAVARIQNSPKTGHIYTHGPQPLPHQASREGESPASWTKALEQSITTHAHGVYLRAESEVRVGARHGAPLEWGTVHMGPRPFIQPSVEEVRPLFLEAMRLLIASLGGGGTGLSFISSLNTHIGIAQTIPPA